MKFRFSLRSLFLLVVVTSVLFSITMNWKACWLRLTVGPRVSLQSVEFHGLNDDNIVLLIEGRRVHTADSRTLHQVLALVLVNRDTDRIPDFQVRGVWRTGNSDRPFLVQIGDNEWVYAYPLDEESGKDISKGVIDKEEW